MHHPHTRAQHWKTINHAERLFLQDKFLLNEDLTQEKLGKYSNWQVFRDLILVFFILISIAYGLKLAENSLVKVQQTVTPSQLKQHTRTVWQNFKQEVKHKIIFDKIFSISPVFAASFSGEFDSQSHTIVNIKPDKSFTYVIKFKNTGSETWKNSGHQAVGVKSFTSPSRVFHSSWLNHNTPTLMTEDSLAPGQVGTFTLILHAPPTTGLSEERFVVTAGDSEMIPGTKFNIPFNVTHNTNASIPHDIVTVEIPKTSQDSAISDSNSDSNSSSSTNNISNSSNQSSSTSSDSPNHTPQALEENQDVPPQTQGDAPNIDTNPIQDNVPAYIESISIEEPQNVRVGLYYTSKPIKLTANQPYYIKDGYGQIVERIEPFKITTVEFSPANKQYYLNVNNRSRISLSYLQFKSEASDPIFTLTSLNNIPSWNKSLNFNQFRNSLEIRYAPATQRLWVINELPMEQYIAGIAETSNVSHIEFHKALAVAARSYALYHYNRGTKHASEHFTLDATYDQVYKGYTSEFIMPRYAQAVNDTTGQVVTYNDKPVITPYFSQSDGRTRDWTEVWGGGPKKWLVSMTVPQDSGKTLLGHGVGLSAWGALRMATYEDKTYDQILKYFYQGTEVERIY